MRTGWTLAFAVLIGCTQASEEPSPEVDRVVAAADKLDAAATKLESAAASLESSTRALEAMRAEDEAARKREAERVTERVVARPPRGGDPSPSSVPGAEDAIACATEGQCTVKRSFFSALMKEPVLLAKQMRIIPSSKDGKTVGMKLYAIRAGSLPSLLGLRNGDTLVRVGGNAIDSPDAAMKAYAAVRDADHITVEVLRGEDRLIMEYAVVD